jgi:hypothetical protein
MSKDEFIKLLETLDFEELRCATISYYKKKPSKYSYENDNYNPKTICIGTDLEHLINEQHSYTCNLFEEAMRRINDLESKGE